MHSEIVHGKTHYKKHKTVETSSLLLIEEVGGGRGGRSGVVGGGVGSDYWKDVYVSRGLILIFGGSGFSWNFTVSCITQIRQ